MIVDNNITRGDFEKSLKLQGLEAFTEEQVSSWVSGTRELIEKSEREELSDIEKSSIEEFKVDVLSLKRVTVVEDDLTKSTMFIRPAQVIWDVAEDGEILKARSGTYANTPENRKLGRVGQKYGSKKGGEEKKEDNSPKKQPKPSSDTTEHNGKKYKKQTNGKWMEVSDSHGLTKKEHEGKGLNSGDDSYAHTIRSTKLSDKEHTDEEVGLGEKKEGHKQGDTLSHNGVNIHVGKDKTGGQDTTTYEAPTVSDKRWHDLGKLKELIDGKKGSEGKQEDLDSLQKELDSIVNKEDRKFTMKEAERKTFLQDKIKYLKNKGESMKIGNSKD